MSARLIVSRSKLSRTNPVRHKTEAVPTASSFAVKVSTAKDHLNFENLHINALHTNFLNAVVLEMQRMFGMLLP